MLRSFASESLEDALDKDDPQEFSHFSDEWDFYHDGWTHGNIQASSLKAWASFLLCLLVLSLLWASFPAQQTVNFPIFSNFREREIKSKIKVYQIKTTMLQKKHNSDSIFLELIGIKTILMSVWFNFNYNAKKT